MRQGKRHARGKGRGLGAGLFGLLFGLGFCPIGTAPASAQGESAWDIVHTPDSWEHACAQIPSGPDQSTDKDGEQILNLTLGMKDAQVVCTLLRAYTTNTDVPMRWKDDYDPIGDAIWREELRQDCAARNTNVTGCVERTVWRMRAGTKPSEKATPYRENENPYSSDALADWNRPDATLIEFTWTPCTPFLVQRGLARWRAQHLNIVTTGVDPVRLDRPPIPDNPLRKGLHGEGQGRHSASLPDFPRRSDGQDERRDEEAREDSARNGPNACLRAVTVRSTIRDRWANYAHVQFRENPAAAGPDVPKDQPAPPADEAADQKAAREASLEAAKKYHQFWHADFVSDNLMSSDGKPIEPLFRSGYLAEDDYYTGEAPVSTVTDIEWRNSWLNRQQWLVLLRDHFLHRVKTPGLDPSYALPEFGRLVDCGSDVRYGNIPSGKQYYWHNDNPDDHDGCHWINRDRERALDPSGEFVALDISYNPDAALAISHGPLYHDYWTRAQTRFVSRAVERLARYRIAAPLVQNDRDPLSPDQPAPLGPVACPHPLPRNADARKCNAEAPPRDAVTPRLGDVYNGPPMPPGPHDHDDGPPTPAKGS
jgi:hypothetical protein